MDQSAKKIKNEENSKRTFEEKFQRIRDEEKTGHCQKRYEYKFANKATEDRFGNEED